MNFESRQHNSKNILRYLFAASIMLCCCVLISLSAAPFIAYAEDSNASSSNDIYSLYDTKQNNQQITIDKIWDDGLGNDARYLSGKDTGDIDYKDLLSISIMTGIPQSALRTYQIVYDANGGSFGTDSSGDSITTNAVTYNAKNATTVGTYAVPASTSGYVFIGWSTSKTGLMDATATDAARNPDVQNAWLNNRKDKSVTTLYAVWKTQAKIRYAVMAYGIGVDVDKDGNRMGITFGPALGYPEFSQYNNSAAVNTTVKPAMTRHHTTADTSIMDETAAVCTDDSHSIITDSDDAGVDAAGNRYRCLHYDNWNTIIYWNKRDPHVYDKCIGKGCSKTVTITPTPASVSNGIFSVNGRKSTGDGDSYIISSAWDLKYTRTQSLQDLREPKQGYAASLIRAKLVGADSYTNAGEYYAGSDALMKYTQASSILACFPENLQDAIGYKRLSGNADADYKYDTSGNEDACDKLWLLSTYEMNSGGKPVYAGNSIVQDAIEHSNKTRSSRLHWWLRSPNYSYSAVYVRSYGYVGNYNVSQSFAVAPGFTLE